MPELAVIIVVALVVLGPKRLPEVARSLGKGLAETAGLGGASAAIEAFQCDEGSVHGFLLSVEAARLQLPRSSS